jgi:chromosomal replication initiator protein
VLATSRRAPAEVRGLSPALVSRLSGGLIVPLAVPEAVLERLTADPVGARPTFATPAQLRHAVLQLAHPANLDQGNIDVQQVDNLIRQHTPEAKGTIRQITVAVARHFQLSVGDLRGPTRQQNIVQARSLAMYLCRELTGASYAEVGRHFGGRDHSTAMHACRKMAKQIAADPSFKEVADDLSSQITLSLESA